MPLPILFWVGAAALGAIAAKKGYDAYSDSEEASSLNQDAIDVFEKGQRSLKTAKTQCTDVLEALGQQKLEIYAGTIGRYASLMEPIRNVERPGPPQIDRLGSNAFSSAELAQMKKHSDLASELLGGGTAAIGTGGLIGVASYGGATMLATASTGTAISTLTGVAATNATLAWFGGGSLAAGGLGVAGGMAVLGGIVAAPVLAVGGFVLAAKAREKLAAARSNHALATKQAAEMRAAASVVSGIREVANLFWYMLAGLDERTTQLLDDFEIVIKRHGTDFSKYAEDDQRKVWLTHHFVKGLRAVADAPLLTKSGALTKSYPKALEHGRSLLRDERARVMTLPGGGRYEGAILDGEMHGRGVLTLPDGSWIKGVFLNGLFPENGQVAFSLPDGAGYEGTMVDGEMHGQGIWTFPDGSRSEGTFLKGDPHGEHTLIHPDGTRKTIQPEHLKAKLKSLDAMLNSLG